jgi:hypothetical protein
MGLMKEVGGFGGFRFREGCHGDRRWSSSNNCKKFQSAVMVWPVATYFLSQKKVLTETEIMSLFRD